MNKMELIAAVSGRMEGATHRETREMIDALTAVVGEALAAGDKVSLPGFGTFERKYSAPREAVNPRSGQKIDVKGRYRATFKAGATLKDVVNPGPRGAA